MLAVLPAMTALGGSILRLEQRKSNPMDGDFTTENLRYKCTERFSVYGSGSFSNNLAARVDLSEASIEDMLNQMRDNMKLANYAVRPTRIIVSPPAQYKDWSRARDREKIKTVWEWLWKRTLPA